MMASRGDLMGPISSLHVLALACLVSVFTLSAAGTTQGTAGRARVGARRGQERAAAHRGDPCAELYAKLRRNEALLEASLNSDSVNSRGKEARSISSSSGGGITSSDGSSSSSDGNKVLFAFASPSDTVACTRSVAFNATRDLGNLRSIQLTLQSFYSLIHVAKRSPDPRLPIEYDVIARLRALGDRTDWQHAEQFYRAVAEAIDKLDDGHTVLQLNCPPFVHRLALPLVALVDKGVPTVQVAPEALSSAFFTHAASLPPFNFSARGLWGATVQSIEGVPAWHFFATWADARAGAFHDIGQKLNYAGAHLAWRNGTRVVSYGAFGTQFYNPGGDSIKMTVVRVGSTAPEVVHVPWLSHTSSKDGFRSADAYNSTYCAPTSVPKSADSFDSGDHSRVQEPGKEEAGADDVAQGDVMPASEGLAGAPPTPRMKFRRGELVKGPQRIADSAEARVNAIDVNITVAHEISKQGDYWKVYALDDGLTAVVALSTFAPDLGGDSDAALWFFADETIKALRIANESSSRVILDLSGNGGGYVVLVGWLMELLLGSREFSSPRVSQRYNLNNFLADTALVHQLRTQNAGAYNCSEWEDLENRNFSHASCDEFFYPTQRKRFGRRGVPGYYSSLFKGQDVGLSPWYGRKFPPAFGAKPFMLFSDGKCFSACSTFAIMMKALFGVPLVTIGGLKGPPMAFSAAGGGFVAVDIAEDIFESIPADVKEKPGTPQPFTFNMTLAVRWANGYLSKGADVPLEFTFVPADHRIDYTPENVLDPSVQYLEAAKFF